MGNPDTSPGIGMVEPAGAHNPGKRARIVEKPLDYQHHWPVCVSGYVLDTELFISLMTESMADEPTALRLPN